MMVAVALLQSPLASAEVAIRHSSPAGVWVTAKGKARVRIGPCGDNLCGWLVWMASPRNAQGQLRLDRHNPDVTKRQKPLLGLQLLNGFRRQSPASRRWIGGKIYNAKNGRRYKAVLTLRNANTLNVRGFIVTPLLGGSQNWTRYQP